jgi:YD repeat-containing protein
MPTRTLLADGKTWRVFPSGFVTQYDRDEFGLLFVHGDGDSRVVRVTRYSPLGVRSREQSLADLSDADLLRLFGQSQPSFTSPEAGYAP